MNWMPALRAGRPVPAGLSCQLSAQVRPAKEGRRTGLDRVAAAFSVVAREELDVDLAVVLVVKKEPVAACAWPPSPCQRRGSSEQDRARTRDTHQTPATGLAFARVVTLP